MFLHYLHSLPTLHDYLVPKSRPKDLLTGHLHCLGSRDYWLRILEKLGWTRTFETGLGTLGEWLFPWLFVSLELLVYEM